MAFAAGMLRTMWKTMLPTSRQRSKIFRQLVEVFQHMMCTAPWSPL